MSTSTAYPLDRYIEDFLASDDVGFDLSREILKVEDRIAAGDGGEVAWGLGQGWFTGRVANPDGTEATFDQVMVALLDAYTGLDAEA